jgi:hypothetical protein
MKNSFNHSFNYSGFCKSAYSFNSKKSADVVGGKNSPQEDPAWRCPPYLAQTPVSRYLKGSE